MTQYLTTSLVAVALGALVIGAIALVLQLAPTLNGIAG